jgi:beta-phosphoglucomutase
MQVADLFNAVIDPASVAHGKPAPDIFLAAAAALGVAPAAMLGVEDSQAGVAAIKAAGMYALGVGDADVLAQADEVIPHIAAFSLANYA